MRFDLVIFDCDGVLVDSEAISNRVLAELLSGFGNEISPAMVKRMFVGRSVEAIGEQCREDLGLELPADWATAYYGALLPALERVEPMPGIANLLERLTGSRIPICVASQGPLEKMDVTLRATRLAPFSKSVSIPQSRSRGQNRHLTCSSTQHGNAGFALAAAQS